MAIGRLAGTALNFLIKGQGPGELAARLAPDVLFAGIEAALTPGDLADKAIAGLSSGVGGATGGLLLGKLGRGNQIGNILFDSAGSIGGDMIGRMAGNQLLKGKDLAMGGKGQTPYDKLNEKELAKLKEAVETQVLADLGLLPGSAQQYLVDPSTGMGVA